MSAITFKMPRWYLKTKSRYRRASAILERIAPLTKPVGCEIGVRRADMSSILLEEKPDLFLVMVDSWEGGGRAYTVTEGEGVATYSDEKQETNYRTALAVTEFASARRKVCRMRSAEAAAQFPDRHFDFVFIDADHSYEGCKADIAAWEAKVKPGGWLCGHDYDNTHHPEFGVKRAVDEYCAARGLVLETGGNFTWFART
jgi:hypothetical protein